MTENILDEQETNNKLPSGWVETTLGDVCDKIGDGLHGTPKYTDNGEYFFINGNNIVNGKIEIKDDTKKVSQDEFLKYKKELNKNTILLSINGTIGNLAIYRNENCILGKSSAYLNIKKGVSRNFIYYLLLDNKFQHNISKNANGSTIKNVGLAQLRNYNFYIPPLPEQKAIASVLSAFDDKIELLREENKTLEEIGKTIFNEWFGKYGVDDELPEGWRAYKFKDLVKQLKPGTNYQPDRINYGIPFVNGRNVKCGFLELNDITYISQEEYERVHQTWQPEENDILITRIGTLGNVGVILRENLPLAVHYNSIVVKESILTHQFIYFLMISKYFQNKYHNNKKQAVQEFVTIENVEDINIGLPQIELINQSIFIYIFEKTKNNHRQIQILSHTREELLPRLMSGEVRVKDFYKL